jgi:hypothetical protein
MQLPASARSGGPLLHRIRPLRRRLVRPCEVQRCPEAIDDRVPSQACATRRRLGAQMGWAVSLGAWRAADLPLIADLAGHRETPALQRQACVLASWSRAVGGVRGESLAAGLAAGDGAQTPLPGTPFSSARPRSSKPIPSRRPGPWPFGTTSTSPPAARAGTRAPIAAPLPATLGRR